MFHDTLTYSNMYLFTFCPPQRIVLALRVCQALPSGAHARHHSSCCTSPLFLFSFGRVENLKRNVCICVKHEGRRIACHCLRLGSHDLFEPFKRTLLVNVTSEIIYLFTLLSLSPLRWSLDAQSVISEERCHDCLRSNNVLKNNAAFRTAFIRTHALCSTQASGLEDQM